MSAALKASEQRRVQRVPIRVLVEYGKTEDFLFDYTANVSLGGMFIRTDRPLGVGTRFKLRLRIPGRRRPMETFAEVRWCVEPAASGAMESGMGVRFESLSPSDERAVAALIDEWEEAQELSNVLHLRA